MAAPYSKDLREKIVKAKAKGRTQAQLAADFGVSESFVSRLLARWRNTSSVAPLPRGGGRRPSLDADGMSALGEMVTADSDATFEELCARIEQKVGVVMSTSAMDRALKKLALPRKKSRFTLQSATRRESKA
jgi:transposase